VRLAPLSSLCHTNEYIHLQKNYNSPKRLNPDIPDFGIFRISRIISKPVGARLALALYGKYVCAAKRATARVAPTMFSAAKFGGNIPPQHCDTYFRDRKHASASRDTCFRDRKYTSASCDTCFRDRKHTSASCDTYFRDRKYASASCDTCFRDHKYASANCDTYFQTRNWASGKRIFNQKQEKT
jgi:hypothetical protein